MNNIEIGKQQFNSYEELVNWMQKPDVGKRIDELFKNDKCLFNYFMMLFYHQIMNHDKICNNLEFKWFPNTNQCNLEFEYINGKSYHQLTMTKEEREKHRKTAVEMIKSGDTKFIS